MSFYKEGIEKIPILGDMKIDPIGEMLQDKIHRLETENFALIEQNENLLKAYKEDEAVIEEMAKYIDEITEDIAREKGIEDFKFCNERYHNEDDYIEYKECIIEWARNKAKEKKNDGR